jgi:hypothetical protein
LLKFKQSFKKSPGQLGDFSEPIVYLFISSCYTSPVMTEQPERRMPKVDGNYSTGRVQLFREVAEMLTEEGLEIIIDDSVEQLNGAGKPLEAGRTRVVISSPKGDLNEFWGEVSEFLRAYQRFQKSLDRS